MGSDRPEIAELYEKFLAFERASDVSKIETAGVRIWPLLRFSVFEDFILPRLVRTGAAHPDIKLQPRDAGAKKRKWPKRASAFISRLRHGPSCAWRPRDILFALNPRQILLPDGREVSQMLDFFLPSVRRTYAVLESKVKSAEYPPRPGWKRVFHLDGYSGRLKAFRSKLPPLEIAAAAHAIAAELAGAFGVDVDEERLAASIRPAAATRLFYHPLFVKWLRRLRVKCVVTAVNYSILNMVLAEAAHSTGIPVVELQHGTIYPAHPAYNLPESDPLHSPDYLFAWGPHWAAQTRNYALKKTVCTGYPMLEYMLGRHPSSVIPAKKRIVFISQGTIGAGLSRRATELVRLLPKDAFEVVYKLHPNESRTWKSLYPWLVDSGVEVVAGKDRSIYELFATAFATAGVYSTAVIEGVMWGVRSFVFGDMPGGDTMRPFLVDGLMENVSSAEELSMKLQQPGGTPGARVDGSAFWTPGAARSIPAFLDELAEKGEIK